MYSWPCGSCLSKPADMRSCAAKTPITSVNRINATSVLPRYANRTSSRRLTTPASITKPRPGYDPPAVARYCGATPGGRSSLELIRDAEGEKVPILHQVVPAAAGKIRVQELRPPPIQVLEVEGRRDGQAPFNERDRVRADTAYVVGDIDLRREVDAAAEDVRIDHPQFADEPRGELRGKFVIGQQVRLRAGKIEIRIIGARHFGEQRSLGRAEAAEQPAQIAARPEQIDGSEVSLPLLLVDKAAIRAGSRERGVRSAERHRRVDTDAVARPVRKLGTHGPIAQFGVDRHAEQIAVLAVVQEVAEPERVRRDRGIVYKAHERNLVVVAQIVETPFRVGDVALVARREPELAAVGRRVVIEVRHHRLQCQQVGQREALSGWNEHAIADGADIADAARRQAEDRAWDERRLLAVVQHVRPREEGPDRVEPKRVPAELIEAFERELVGRAEIERGHRRRPEDFLELGSRDMRPAQVNRVDDVHTAVNEDVLAPADNLV